MRSSPRFSGDLRSSFGVTQRSVAVKSDSGDDVGDFGRRIRTDLIKYCPGDRNLKIRGRNYHIVCWCKYTHIAANGKFEELLD
ncbi:hypothetical protein J1N35_011550 [Gossypium stocksii]|uniref:Uncharacterized protein n=1 Tax=Gossypium stocksii TaxID=47602 RepID=A0A9D3W315_9ROSI|nr:hypothetical protein J1N35_011550 [Gossypium stocksii]